MRCRLPAGIERAQIDGAGASNEKNPALQAQARRARGWGNRELAYASTTRADMLRATLEGIALSLADSYEVLTRTGTVPHVLYAVGGGFKSRLWAEMIASALGRSLSLIPASETGGALGVARLARQALTGEADAAVYTKPARSSVVDPDPALQARFTDLLPKYRALYRALRPIR